MAGRGRKRKHEVVCSSAQVKTNPDNLTQAQTGHAGEEERTPRRRNVSKKMQEWLKEKETKKRKTALREQGRQNSKKLASSKVGSKDQEVDVMVENSEVNPTTDSENLNQAEGSKNVEDRTAEILTEVDPEGDSHTVLLEENYAFTQQVESHPVMLSDSSSLQVLVEEEPAANFVEVMNDQVVVDDTIEQVAENETIEQVVENDTIEQVVVEDTIEQVAESETTEQVAEIETVEQVVEDGAIEQVAENDAIEQMVENNTVEQVVESDTTNRVLQNYAMGKVVENDTINQVVERDAIAQVAVTDAVEQVFENADIEQVIVQDSMVEPYLDDSEQQVLATTEPPTVLISERHMLDSVSYGQPEINGAVEESGEIMSIAVGTLANLNEHEKSCTEISPTNQATEPIDSLKIDGSVPTAPPTGSGTYQLREEIHVDENGREQHVVYLAKQTSDQMNLTDNVSGVKPLAVTASQSTAVSQSLSSEALTSPASSGSSLVLSGHSTDIPSNKDITTLVGGSLLKPQSQQDQQPRTVTLEVIATNPTTSTAANTVSSGPEKEEPMLQTIRVLDEYTHQPVSSLTLMQDEPIRIIPTHQIQPSGSNVNGSDLQHLPEDNYAVISTELSNTPRPRGYECAQCEHKFTTLSNLKRHMTSHTNERNFQCSYCQQRFKQKVHMEKHINYVHKEKSVQCKFCDYTCANAIPDLKLHMKRKHLKSHPDDPPTYLECSKCGFLAASKKDLKQHSKFHKPGPELKLFCEHCSFVTDAKSRLDRHMMTHNNDKPFTCSHCSYRASQKEHVKRHLRTRHGIITKTADDQNQQEAVSGEVTSPGQEAAEKTSAVSVVKIDGETEEFVIAIPNHSEELVTTKQVEDKTTIQQATSPNSTTVASNELLTSVRIIESLTDTNTQTSTNPDSQATRQVDDIVSDYTVNETSPATGPEEAAEVEISTTSVVSQKSAKLKYQPPDYSLKEKLFGCSHCTMKFVRLLSLYKHLHTQHADLLPDTEEEKRTCVVCDFRAPSHKALLIHMRKHSNQDAVSSDGLDESGLLYMCVLCKYVNVRRRNLYQHLKKKHKISIMVKKDGTTSCVVEPDADVTVVAGGEGEQVTEEVQIDADGNPLTLAEPTKVVNVLDLANSLTLKQKVSDFIQQIEIPAARQTEQVAAEAIVDLAGSSMSGSMETVVVDTTGSELAEEHDNSDSTEQQSSDSQLQLTSQQLDLLTSGDFIEINGDTYQIGNGKRRKNRGSTSDLISDGDGEGSNTNITTDHVSVDSSVETPSEEPRWNARINSKKKRNEIKTKQKMKQAVSCELDQDGDGKDVVRSRPDHIHLKGAAAASDEELSKKRSKSKSKIPRYIRNLFGHEKKTPVNKADEAEREAVDQEMESAELVINSTDSEPEKLKEETCLLSAGLVEEGNSRASSLILQPSDQMDDLYTKANVLPVFDNSDERPTGQPAKSCEQLASLPFQTPAASAQQPAARTFQYVNIESDIDNWETADTGYETDDSSSMDFSDCEEMREEFEEFMSQLMQVCKDAQILNARAFPCPEDPRKVSLNGKHVEQKLTAKVDSLLAVWAEKGYNIELHNHDAMPYTEYFKPCYPYRIFRRKTPTSKSDCDGRATAAFTGYDAHCGMTKKYLLTCAHIFCQDNYSDRCELKRFAQSALPQQFESRQWKIKKHNAFEVNFHGHPSCRSDQCECAMLYFENRHPQMEKLWYRKFRHDVALVEVPDGYAMDGINGDVDVVELTNRKQLDLLYERKVKIYIGSEGDWGQAKKYEHRNPTYGSRTPDGLTHSLCMTFVTEKTMLERGHSGRPLLVKNFNTGRFAIIGVLQGRFTGDLHTSQVNAPPPNQADLRFGLSPEYYEGVLIFPALKLIENDNNILNLRLDDSTIQSDCTYDPANLETYDPDSGYRTRGNNTRSSFP